MRISIGPSSTTRVELSTGPPLRGAISSPLSPSTFHFRVFISDFSWLVDKFVSLISFICKNIESNITIIIVVLRLLYAAWISVYFHSTEEHKNNSLDNMEKYTCFRVITTVSHQWIVAIPLDSWKKNSTSFPLKTP